MVNTMLFYQNAGDLGLTSSTGRVAKFQYFGDHSAKTFERPEWIKLLAELKKYKGKTDEAL